jgi:hypothetical protein
MNSTYMNYQRLAYGSGIVLIALLSRKGRVNVGMGAIDHDIIKLTLQQHEGYKTHPIVDVDLSKDDECIALRDKITAHVLLADNNEASSFHPSVYLANDDALQEVNRHYLSI